MTELNIGEIQKRQLNILHKVAEFCDDNKIRYSLAYGTLIGAIRHKGYIPWDDDIDIVMPRPDYDKFVRCFNGTYKDLKVYTTNIEPRFLYSFAKISDEMTQLIENSNLKSNIGINIDLFPIDGIAANDRKILKRQIFYRKMLSVKIIRLNKNRHIIKNLILIFGRIALSLIPMRLINNMMINSQHKYSFLKENYCCNISFGGIEDKILPKEYFLEYTKHEFEDGMFSITKYYHEWLTSVYGDYMQLPPKEKQFSHHDFRAYVK